MEMTLTNKAMQPMHGFAIQLNKNSFGLSAGAGLQNLASLPAGQNHIASIPMGTQGPVQRMEPLNNLQVLIVIPRTTYFNYFHS